MFPFAPQFRRPCMLLLQLELQLERTLIMNELECVNVEL